MSPLQVIKKALLRYHASPNKFDKFNLNRVGERGEDFGRGVYLGENPKSLLEYGLGGDNGKGFMYKVAIPDEVEKNLLQFHGNLQDQNPYVVQILKSLYGEKNLPQDYIGEMTGLKGLGAWVGDAGLESELSGRGIKGTKGINRETGESVFSVYDPEILSILGRRQIKRKGGLIQMTSMRS